MRYFLVFISFLTLQSIPFAQPDSHQTNFDIRASMGIDFVSSPSLSDYLNRNFILSGDEINDFSSAVIFSVEGGYYLSDSYQLGLEVAYSIHSYNSVGDLGRYDFSYNQIMPTITNYYVLQGAGYNFKFGGGIGARIVLAEETLPGSVGSHSYSATGFGFLLRADGNTALSKTIYANIGGDIKFNYPGELKNESVFVGNRTITETVNLNSLSIGIHLGVTFLF